MLNLVSPAHAQALADAIWQQYRTGDTERGLAQASALAARLRVLQTEDYARAAAWAAVRTSVLRYETGLRGRLMQTMEEE